MERLYDPIEGSHEGRRKQGETIMQYDVCLARKPSAPGPVIVTMTDKGAALRLVKALNDEAEFFFPRKGLIAFHREVLRGPPEPEPEPEPEPTATQKKKATPKKSVPFGKH